MTTAPCPARPVKRPAAASTHPLAVNDLVLLAGIGLAWIGALAYGAIGQDLMPAAAGGAMLLAAAALAAWRGRGGTLSLVALPAFGMGMVALLIHVARGQAEAHFAVFAFLAVTATYRHWLPVVVAAVAIALHHASFNTLQQWGWGPVCFAEPGLTKVVEHLFYVLAESAALVLLALRAQRDLATGRELSALADRLARGDGSVDFSAACAPTSNPATLRVQRALRQVDGAMLRVRRATESIAVAGREITSGSTDLALRSDRTAACLHQTACSVEQLAADLRAGASARRLGIGLAQVGETVSQLDHLMQQNAALVEANTASAESLNAQAARLLEIVGAFGLSGAAPAPPTGAASAPVPSAATPRPTAAPVPFVQSAAYHGPERRGPQRARNVLRVAFGRQAAAETTPAASADGPRTGTGDDREPF